MNERIKELAIQARQIGEYVNYGQIRLSPAQFEQKFAEMIVRECISALDEADGSVHHRECLLEHFGVEE